jgi:hypothetical protein
LGVNDVARGVRGAAINSGSTNRWNARLGFYAFDGADDAISLPTIGLAGTSGLSLATRIVVNAYPSSYGTIFSIYNQANNNYDRVLYLGAGGYLTFIRAGSSLNAARTTAAGVVPLNTPVNIAISWDGSLAGNNVHLYVNGIEPPYTTTQDCDVYGYYDGNGPVYLGGSYPGSVANRPASIAMEYAAIWRRAIGLAGAQLMYATPYNVFAASQSSTGDVSGRPGVVRQNPFSLVV